MTIMVRVRPRTMELASILIPETRFVCVFAKNRIYYMLCIFLLCVFGL